jgi:serine protease inhibitor ecotin
MRVTEQVIAKAKIQEQEQFQAAIAAGRHMDQQCKRRMEGEQLGWFYSQDKLMKNTMDTVGQMQYPDDNQPTIDAWNKGNEERKIFILNIDVRERWSMAEFLHPCNSTFKC